MIPHHWRRAAADNGFSDPNADVRPGRFANSVLGAIRGLMATGAAARDDATGGLVATLGASNVYSVATNEGLIDIGTGINGIPAAITTPFLLRLSFDTVLSGTATNVPHLKVDGFDCGPILRRDKSALVDGDVGGSVSVLVLGEFAAPTDTKVTQVRVLDLLPSDLAAPVATNTVKLLLAGSATITPTVDTIAPVTGTMPDWATLAPSGLITVQKKGIYALSGYCDFGTVSSLDTATYYTSKIYRNGVEAQRDLSLNATAANVGTRFPKSVNVTLFADVGDTLGLYALASPGTGALTAAVLYGGVGATSLIMTKVR